MPSLKDLNCSIELTDTRKKLQELGTTYGDGFVETFVPMHEDLLPFSVHLTSKSFIASGIAMYVFIDGVYQCNRNRQNLKVYKTPERHALDLIVRQKEEKQKDGTLLADEWTFGKLNNADNAPNTGCPISHNNIGCIEIMVLRCAEPRFSKSARPMNFDGASDFADHYFGLDGFAGDWDSDANQSGWDDRGPYFGSKAKKYSPDPMSPRRSFYIKSVNGYGRTQNNDLQPTYICRAISPYRIRKYPRADFPSSEPVTVGHMGFQYGTGPVPRRSEPSPDRGVDEWGPGSNLSNAPAIDRSWLDDVLTKAVKRGIKESKMDDDKSPVSEHSQGWSNAESPPQPPGAWPVSPYAPQDREWAVPKDGSHKNLGSGHTWKTKGDDGWSTVSKNPLSDKEGWTHVERVPKVAEGWNPPPPPFSVAKVQSPADAPPAPFGITWAGMFGDKGVQPGSQASGWSGNLKKNKADPNNNNGWKSGDEDLESSWGTFDKGAEKQSNKANGWGKGSDTWNNKADTWKPDDDHWSVTDVKSLPGNEWTTTSRKSLSKYRQLRSPSSSKMNMHWQPPPPTPSTIFKHPLSITEFPPEKPFKNQHRVENRVLAGEGRVYDHTITRPEYIDHLEKPYATFRFKYRTPSFLSAMFGNIDINTGLHPTAAQDPEGVKAELTKMPRDKLVDEMLKLQLRLEGQEKHGDPKREKCGGTLRTESMAREWTEDWVKRHGKR